MKKSRLIFIPVLGAIFMLVLITRPYEREYDIDQPYGMRNIMSKIEDLADGNPVYKISISSQPEQGDMDFLTISVIDAKKESHREIKFNRSGAFFNSTDSKILNIKGKRDAFEISDLFTKGLGLIEDCKILVPEDYKYRHTEYISVNNGRIASIRIAVAPLNDNDIKKNKYVHLKTYNKESYTGGRRPKKKSDTFKYYIMEFSVDKSGKVSID